MSGLLVLNAGSSSIKFSVYQADADQLYPVCRGQIESLGGAAHFEARDAHGQIILMGHPHQSGQPYDHAQALVDLLLWMRTNSSLPPIVAVGHRVVHGGAIYAHPQLIDSDTLAQLEQFAPLAPLHQPHNLAGIRALASTAPDLPQVACFDTAFHLQQPDLAQVFAIPRQYRDEGVRRYGFHGLSYEYVASQLPTLLGDTGGRTIVAHLGNGSSMCAMRDGVSVASTMGFTAVEGLPMGTRCGSLDPGVMIYLMERHGMDARALTDLVYKRCGLLGLSDGLSHDMRTLLASDSPAARLAVDYFVYRIHRELGSLTAALGGLDTLVFTAGIGEHAPALREQVCSLAGWLGVVLDPLANERNLTRLYAPESKVRVLVVPTNEELMIARHTWRVINDGAN